MEKLIILEKQIEEMESSVKNIDVRVDEINERVTELSKEKNTLNKKRDQLTFEIETMRGKAREVKLAHFDSLLSSFPDQTRLLRGLRLVEETKQNGELLTALQLFEKVINYGKTVNKEQIIEVSRIGIVVDKINFSEMITYLDDSFGIENIVIEFTQENGELYLDIAILEIEEDFINELFDFMGELDKEFNNNNSDEECEVNDCIKEKEEQVSNMSKILAINTSFIEESLKLDELIESTEIIDGVNLDGKTLYCFRDSSKAKPNCYGELLKLFVGEVMKNTIIPKDKINDESIIATVVQLF